MSSAQTRPMRARVQPVSCTGPENPNPGRAGMITWKASAGSPPCAPGSVSGPMTSRNSAIEPGQPWVSSSGTASGAAERTCRK